MSRPPGTVDLTTDIETKTTPPTDREWTIMFYFASDNSLASTIVGQLKALKDARYHPNVNVVAHFDPHVVNTPSQVFDINLVEKLCSNKPNAQTNGFRHLDPFVPNLALDRLPGKLEDKFRGIVSEFVESLQDARKLPRVKYDPPQPTSDLIDETSPKKSLRAFLDFCRVEYPARHYMLVILGHGEIVGNQTFLRDDSVDSSNFMSLQELGEVVGDFSAKAPGKLEMVGFHSCSMSSVEVAFELAGKAKYMLASQGPAYVGSWPYRSLLIRLFNDMDAGKEFDDAAIKKMFLKMFKYCFFNNQDFQMAGYAFDISMVDLDKVEVAKAAISNLGQELSSALTSGTDTEKATVKNLIRLAHLDAQSFSGESYTDLYDFCWRLEWLCHDSKQAGVVNRIKLACNKTRTALRSYKGDARDNDKTFVVSSAFIGAAVQYSHGLSVLFPWTAPVDRDWKTDYDKSRFSHDTKWSEFLATYFKETMRATRTAEFKGFPGKEDDQDQSLGTRLIKLMKEASSNGTANGNSVTGKAFGQIGELSKPEGENTLGKRGPDDPMGKRGPDDPTGLSCDCGTIKNYPLTT